jgi:hypothetical protein
MFGKTKTKETINRGKPKAKKKCSFKHQSVKHVG